MRFAKFGLRMAVALSLLSACQESQIAPELPERQSSEFNVTEIFTGLSNPWSVAEMPNGGGYFITEKSGRLWHVMDASDKTEIKGLPDDIYAKGQGGLLDVVLSLTLKGRESYTYPMPMEMIRPMGRHCFEQE